MDAACTDQAVWSAGLDGGHATQHIQLSGLGSGAAPEHTSASACRISPFLHPPPNRYISLLRLLRLGRAYRLVNWVRLLTYNQTLSLLAVTLVRNFAVS